MYNDRYNYSHHVYVDDLLVVFHWQTASDNVNIENFGLENMSTTKNNDNNQRMSLQLVVVDNRR